MELSGRPRSVVGPGQGAVGGSSMDGVADLVVVALLGALVLLLASSFLLTRSRVRDVLAEARRQADRVRADAEQEAARRIGAARAERDRLLAEAAEHRAVRSY